MAETVAVPLNVATKEDLKQLATKQDLEELKKWAEEKFATKQDLEQLKNGLRRGL